jgi:putative ABC transport system permease protein
VGAAVTVFVGTTGLTDTFLRTIDIGQGEVLKTAPQRVIVGFNTFVPTTVALAQVRATGASAASEARLALPATGHANGSEQGLALTLIDPSSGQWSPTMLDGRLPRAGSSDGLPEIVLSEPGAAVLGARPGDLVVVSHQRRRGLAIEDIDTEMRVVGITLDRLKSATYMDIGDADVFGLRGLTNQISVVPASDMTLSDVQKAMFKLPGAISVESVDAIAKVFRHLVDQYLSLLSIVQYTALALALLIAFNSASIALDERAREHATMFAFGTRLRSVVAMAIVESSVTGVLGTLLGLLLGRLVVQLIVDLVVRDVVPDIGFVITISPATIAVAAVLGILAVGSAPILGIPRLKRLNIPDALRVVE